jgi:hypothetical protein
MFFLALKKGFRYNRHNKRLKNSLIFEMRGQMKKFYYEFWIPFTITKKRILILAIASYIAMC